MLFSLVNMIFQFDVVRSASGSWESQFLRAEDSYEDLFPAETTTSESPNKDAKYNRLADTKENARLLKPITNATWPRLRRYEDVDPRNPQLDFIKLNKVGGTSVAVGLNNVAKRYKIPTHTGCDDGTDATFFYHHHTVASTAKCFKGGLRNIVTVIREPEAMFLSDKTWAINRDFFITFDEKRVCTEDGSVNGGYDCLPVLAQKRDYALKKFRKEILPGVKSRVGNHRICYEMCTWLQGTTVSMNEMGSRVAWERKKLASTVIDYLSNEYLLVGVTDYLDHFIVLLGLHFKWDLNEMVYHKCKSLHGTSIKMKSLKAAEQNAIKRIIAPSSRTIYSWAKTRFEALLAELGEPFEDLVRAFKAEVKSRRASLETGAFESSLSLYRWEPTTYVNGYTEYC